MLEQVDLLLIGGGHTHLVAMRDWWRKRQRPQGKITLITPSVQSYYSGRISAWLIGRASADACTVDIAALCRCLDIELITGTVHGFDATRHLIASNKGFWQGRVVSFDTGATPHRPEYIAEGTDVLTVKPFIDFTMGIERWRQQPEPLAVIGGGMAGVELALALAQTLPDVALISASKILPTASVTLRQRVRQTLAESGITVLEGTRISCLTIDGAYSAVSECLHAHNHFVAVQDRILSLQKAHDAFDKTHNNGDEISRETADTTQQIWAGSRFVLAMGGMAWSWYRHSGLTLDDRGFVRVLPTLQSIAHPLVFASGDCATLADAPKGDIDTVQQGMVLATNLARALYDKPLRKYIPQPSTLVLLADGTGGALMAWRGKTAQGHWCGWWRDYLDQRYLRSMKV